MLKKNRHRQPKHAKTHNTTRLLRSSGFIAALVITLPALAQPYAINQMGQLVDGATNYRMTYPCSAGGQPLVIYSMPIGNITPIESNKTIYPLYVRPGYQASPLSIPTELQTSHVSTQNLTIQTTNPAIDSIHFQLSRVDQQPFYVNSINFPPVVIPKPGTEGTREKYVSTYQAFINQESRPLTQSSRPEYNYSFVQDTGLLLYTPVTSVTATYKSWNQNTEWTDGNLGLHTALVQYRFVPQRSDDDPDLFNGYGFWVCGADTPPASKQLKATYGKTIMDKTAS